MLRMIALDYREKALRAAGWRCEFRKGEKDIVGFFYLYDDTGKMVSGGYNFNQAAWEYAPAVEESFNEAHKYLRLDEHHRWKFIEVPYAKPPYWIAMIQDIRIDTAMQECAYAWESPQLEIAMIGAFLTYKMEHER